jgi:murein DD-endopeptidase MepM/ murein hydrolase activator NlpD
MSRIRRYGQTGPLPPSRALTRTGRPLPQIYLSKGKPGRRVYLNPAESRSHGVRWKWLASTLLAAAVGAIAIGYVAYSTIDDSGERGLFDMIEEAGSTVFETPAPLPETAMPITFGKSDRLEATASGLVTKKLVREQVRQLVGDREAISYRPYVRIIASLAATLPGDADRIPAFNPLQLFANDRPVSGAPGLGASDPIKIEVVDLPGGILLAEDGQELSDADILRFLRAAEDEEAQAATEATSGSADGAEDAAADSQSAGGGLDVGALHATTLAKNVFDDEEAARIEGQQTAVEQVKAGDTLSGILRRHGIAAWQTKLIAEAAKTVLDTDILVPGQLVRLTLVPSPADPSVFEPASVTLFSEGQGHLATIARNAAGDFTASETATTNLILAGAQLGEPAQRANLYQSFYSTALGQGMTEAMVVAMLRTYAYDTDFKRRVGPGDSFDVFFDLSSASHGGDAKPGDLLYMSLTVGGETRQFYRFRTPDGATDYYDAQGNNAKRFLMRKPVRGDVRFTSGFGMRLHPLLKQRRMHTGVDWSAPIGTPILASGSGTIEEVERRGGNGNFIRIRHANGYQTTYSHLSRFAQGLAPGLKVSQGQTIGFVGSTGISSGPHLHFEVLINNSYVDPMTIHVPRERQLKGREIADFEKERRRIDELMDLAPVTMGMIDGAGNGG